MFFLSENLNKNANKSYLEEFYFKKRNKQINKEQLIE